jgi:acetyl-CoA C-acetyltransferase
MGMKEVYIVSAKRTPIGGFLGMLSPYSATELGTWAIRDAYTSIGVPSDAIDAVYMGNVLSANLGQAPARQSAVHAGLSPHTDCTTINKVCASGLKAVMIGAQQVQLQQADLVIAGGMESMSNTPHYLFQRRQLKLGEQVLADGIVKDGLTDAFCHFHMGNAAERCARQYSLSREEQDRYALASYAKAARATKEGKFKNEIIPIIIKTKNGDTVFEADEDINKIIPEKVAKLQPAFENGGTITAANASNLNDGAAAVLLASETAVQQYQLKPLAKVIAYADAALSPEQFTIAPSIAIPKALQQAGLSLNDIDFIELNEAYAAVMLANQKILGLDENKVNSYGGAIAMGHPLGASGARILCTLLSVLQQEKGTYGIAAICNGGGGASAMIIKNLSNNEL